MVKLLLLKKKGKGTSYPGRENVVAAAPGIWGGGVKKKGEAVFT